MNILNAEPRVDLRLVADMIESGAKVLDVGCDDGSLLKLLETTKGVDGRGIELSQRGVNECVSQGLSVIQGDADRDLSTYPDNAFDYVIMSQTLQATHAPKDVLEQLLRIGRRVVISIPNFGHWRVRLQLTLMGRMPVTENLPYSWYNTPNIHFCTLRDFTDLCREVEATIVRSTALNAHGQKLPIRTPWWFWNMFGDQAVFMLAR